MASENNFSNKCNAKLLEAYKDASSKEEVNCAYKDFIDLVIDGNCLTFRYILFTALLSKATDENINTLCLQKKSQLDGSYDARSICHSVIVPFEKKTLKKALGGSNEPFLNKPARFPELSKDNPVRGGNNRKILDSLCDNLPKIETSKIAYSCLVYLLFKLIKIRNKEDKLLNFTVPESENIPSKLMAYIKKALEENYGGEILTLMIAGTYHLMYKDIPNIRVEVHPVNESGASTKEISDLDIYKEDNLISSNELKDKPFSETDVRHAADKVLRDGGNHMLFIVGPHGYTTGKSNNFLEDLEDEYQSKNFFLRIIKYSSFLDVMLPSIIKIDSKEFMKYILQTAHETKFKKETINYLDNLGKSELGLNYLLK